MTKIVGIIFSILLITGAVLFCYLQIKEIVSKVKEKKNNKKTESDN